MQSGSTVQTLHMPKIASQKVAFTTATTVTLNAATNYIRILADSNFNLEDDGTAATANEPLHIANIEYIYDVEGLSTFSVYDGSS
jgi:hypothetical protein